MRKRPLSLWLCWGWWAWLWLMALLMLCMPASTAYADDCLTNPFNLADCLRTPGYREAYVTAMVALGVEPVLISQILKQSGRQDLSDQDINDWIRKRLGKWAKKKTAQAAGSTAASGTADFLNQVVKPDNRQGPAPPTVTPLEHFYDYTPGRIMSGVPAERYLRSIGAWEKLKGLKKGDSWDDKIKAMEGDPGKTPVTDFSIPWKDDGTVDMDNIVFVMPDLPSATPPPPAPDQVTDSSGGGEEEAKYGDEDKKEPDEATDPVEEKKKKPPTPKDNLDRYRGEKKEAVKKLNDLNARADKLNADWVKKERDWSLTRIKAASDAIVDLADFLKDLVSPVWDPKLQNAYVGDLAKNALKEILGLVERGYYYPDSFFEDAKLGPVLIKLFDDATNPGGYSLVGIVEHIWNPSKLAEDAYKYINILPGGVLKQMTQNWLVENSRYRGAKVLGPLETAIGAGKDALDRYYEVDELHHDMGKISDELVEVRKEVRQQEFNRDVAQLGMDRSQKDVEEWNRLFPRQAQRR